MAILLYPFVFVSNPALNDDQRWSIIDSKAKEQRLSSLFRLLSENSLIAIVIKGWSVGRFYPPDSPRGYTDIDIAVASDDFERTASVLASSRSNIGFDLHRGLRHLDTRPWSEILKHSYEVELSGTPIRVLADEDNLRVAAIHWLTDGGVYKEKLWDIYYLVKNRRSDFDWDRCLTANGEIRKTWVLSAIATAREYLELDTGDLPPEMSDFRLPDWFRKTLEREWNRGPYLRVPLRMCFRDPRILAQQIRRRFPPNRIAATIDVEGVIDESSRIPYQLRSLKKKISALLRAM